MINKTYEQKTMPKGITYKIGKRIIIFWLISLFVYIIISFVLIYLPTPEKKEVKNYDFSSIKKRYWYCIGRKTMDKSKRRLRSVQ